MSAMLKSGMLFQYESELDAFLEFLIWRFSIRVDKPTPGNALMNLRYRDERAVEVRGKVACRYRNIIERALRARLVYWSPHMNRTEMLLLLLPLLNSTSVKNFIRPFSKDKSSDSSVDDTLCPICQGKPTIPFLAIPCQHSYCYYCLQTRCSAAPSFRCPQCGEAVAAMQRHGGLVNNISQKQ
ncbi:peroxisome biogenesis protein 2-like isoform X2 [Nicotiana sylvestris]|uniref:peroxisome biogenesis protein 2-like isoform X2 n=1 Tax=Nicotiana sylvestris TaxID=4096 RepID=UPI00388CDE72